MVRPDTPAVSGAPIPLNPGYNSGFLKRIGEAEAEVQRLTKTVKIVEVEVREDSEPLREEI